MVNKENLSDPKVLAHYIDHTLLRPEATREEIEKLCSEALEYRFFGVCVETQWLTHVLPILGNGGVKAVTVLDFPKGSSTTKERCEQAAASAELGAHELDIVLARRWLHEKNYKALYEDLASVVRAAGSLPLKVILETSELTNLEKEIASAIAKCAGAAYVKTSTGFSKSGATEGDVRLMREVVGKDIGVKASGGIRSYPDAVKMILAGASRLGTSASVHIVQATSSPRGGY